MDGYVVAGAAVVGFLVGLTGAGGGALMTPMLILVFGVKPAAAISSDLVAAVVMRPLGAAVHLRRGTVNLGMVAWLSAGSIPAAFAGSYVLHLLGHTSQAQTEVERALGAALLLGAAAMALRHLLDRRSGRSRQGRAVSVRPRPVTTVAIGATVGLIVGITSVGAGSLTIVLLMFVYPSLSANELVGVDLTQAIPLTASAALGALIFGHVELPVTASLVAGSVPAVLVGSLLSSRVPDRWVRPAIGAVIFASGLKYVGVGPRPLALSLACVTLTVALTSLLSRRRRPGVLTTRTSQGSQVPAG